MMVNIDSVGFFRGLRMSLSEGTEAGSRERRRAGRTRHELTTAQAACREGQRIFASACAAAQPPALRSFWHVRIFLVHGSFPRGPFDSLIELSQPSYVPQPPAADKRKRW